MSSITPSASGRILCSDPGVFSLPATVVGSVGLPRKAWATIGARGTTRRGVQSGQFGALVRRKLLLIFEHQPRAHCHQEPESSFTGHPRPLIGSWICHSLCQSCQPWLISHILFHRCIKSSGPCWLTCVVLYCPVYLANFEYLGSLPYIFRVIHSENLIATAGLHQLCLAVHTVTKILTNPRGGRNNEAFTLK